MRRQTVQMTSAIRADFDRIALLQDESWDHSSHYHGFLLRQLPAHCEYALDIGCGTGSFSRLLADRSERVLALDLSSQMIGAARKRSRGYTNIEYRVADATVWDPFEGQFDCIASIATMHHLPMEGMLAKMRRALKANGRLAILDLYHLEKSWTNAFYHVLALAVSKGLRLLKTGRLGESRQVQQLWAAHGRHDSYLTLTQIHQASRALLPDVQVRKHLLWRYSLVWKKEPHSR